MAELSNSELLILDNILGFNIGITEKDTVEELIARIESKRSQLANGTTSEAEITEFITAAKNKIAQNPSFGDYEVVDFSRANGETAPMATFASSDKNDIVVAFWGTTGPDEWYDNVKAAGNYFINNEDDNPNEKGSFYQEDATEYIDKISEKFNNSSITVTGHSKGGNKAQYVALMSENVDRCVSFDGQGFSSDFIEEFSEKIKARKHIITSISADKDIVNSLLPSIAGTKLYVDTSTVPSEYTSNFFFFHKPNILLNTDGELLNTEGVQPSNLANFIQDYTVYMSRIEDDRQRELAIELLACIARDVMTAPKGQEIDAALKHLNNIDNTEALGCFLAYTFEYAEEKNLSYDEFLNVISSAGVDTTKLNNWYLPILWDALFDASKTVSVNEFVNLCEQVRSWGVSKGLNTWEAVLNYIVEDPIRIVDLYSSLDLSQDTVNKSVGSFASEDNIANLIGSFITNHPIITTIGVSALTIPAVRETIAVVTSVVAAVGVCALIANHIWANRENIAKAIAQAHDYVEEKVSEFFNEAKNAAHAQVTRWVSNVYEKAEKYITRGSRIVNSLIDGATDFWDFLKEQTVTALNNMLLISNPLLYLIASKVYKAKKEPLTINATKISDCVDIMNRLASRVATIDQRLDDLYKLLAKNNIEESEGVFTSLANLYNLFSADLNVDEGQLIKRKARALTDLYDDYESVEKWVVANIPQEA